MGRLVFVLFLVYLHSPSLALLFVVTAPHHSCRACVVRWDDRASELGSVHLYILSYFLEDGTMEMRELVDSKGGKFMLTVLGYHDDSIVSTNIITKKVACTITILSVWLWKSFQSPSTTTADLSLYGAKQPIITDLGIKFFLFA